jgi:hypothetical protein
MHEKVNDIITHRTEAEEVTEEVGKEPTKRSSKKRKSMGLVKVRPL